ncbi:DUF6919 domain-containing protein [Streptomyces sp. NPDC093097]|uniref:DUF6919 domain-containing protein n=1 Tax=Streptomyces sp. NPDC093097 TaxID=3366027 RepID=UPI00381C6FF0
MPHLPWMSRTDRARWNTARTLNDLAQLTAEWWEGTVRSLPGHRASHRPHPTLAAHTPVLAAANRAGFLIPAAQAGVVHGKARNKAAVWGFATDPALIRRLVDAAERAGLQIVLNDLLDANYGSGEGITVSTRNGQAEGVFGEALGLPEMQAMWRGFPQAVEAVVPALQITFADPQFGGPSTLLWDTLAKAIASPPACRQCGCTERELCGDGCSGVRDHADGRCAVCIDPDVLIDWSTQPDPEPRECALCGAPFYSARRYCTTECEDADADEGEADDQDEVSAATAVPAEKHDDPWATYPV